MTTHDSLSASQEAIPGRSVDGKLPPWRRASRGEYRLAANIGVMCAIVLQTALPSRLAVVDVAVLAPIEGSMLLGLNLLNPRYIKHQSTTIRRLSLALIGAMTLSNTVAAARLIRGIIIGAEGLDPVKLLLTAASIWLTNVLVFALWYWEFDRGGPNERAHGRDPNPDFVFPQMQSPDLAGPDWRPEFVDYLYVSFTNATAFSPTDTLPFSRWAKSLMLVQSAVSLSTVGLVIARAVNLLK